MGLHFKFEWGHIQARFESLNVTVIGFRGYDDKDNTQEVSRKLVNFDKIMSVFIC